MPSVIAEIFTKLYKIALKLLLFFPFSVALKYNGKTFKVYMII